MGTKQSLSQEPIELSFEFSNKIGKNWIGLDWIGTESFLMLERQKGILHRFAQRVHCLVPPCCFSSSQSASLL